MKEYQRTKKQTRRIFAPWFVVILIIILGFCARGVYKIYQKHEESQKNLARVQQEMNELNERKKTLEKEVGELDTAQGMEAEVRSRFQVSKEGEKVIIFNDEDADQAMVVGDDTEQTQKSLWQKFAAMVSGWFGGNE